jgi:DNA invertase Pin-like site-specific DNA recombinase
VVVYKVDRLTRSLADFAKIVDIFDAHGVAFVSVTQHFNTTTSMGRLTLNVLLSFAQFEREVAGERIRDKIAASKQRGMWMGGNPPLGYDVCDRKLVVNEAEARRFATSSVATWHCSRFDCWRRIWPPAGSPASGG